MKKNKSILILGASGMVGGEILKYSLNHPSIQKVYALSRRELNINPSKLHQIIHSDFNDYAPIETILKELDAIYYCIGVYTGKANKEVFYKVTIDFAVNLAKAVKNVNPNCTFCYLSGAGADRKEKSRFIFARTKGIAENQLMALLSHFYSFRPNFIYPVTPRKEVNDTYGLTRNIYRLLFYSPSSFSKIRMIQSFTRFTSITSQQLAQSMLEVGLNRYSKQILEHKDIHSIYDNLHVSN